MQKTKKLVAGLGMAAIAALSVHAGLNAEVASGTKDDFLTPKNQNAASDPFESFQKRFEHRCLSCSFRSSSRCQAACCWFAAVPMYRRTAPYRIAAI